MAITQIIPAGDLALENGNFVWIDGVQMIRQNIAARFKFFLGEWFLDLREGIPYYRDVLVKNPDISVVTSIFRQVLKDTPGVLEIRKFILRFNAVAREITLEFNCLVDGGEVVVTPEDTAFIIKV
jgi:hypothetical protein